MCKKGQNGQFVVTCSTMNQNVLQMKAQFSIEGIGTLPIISLPTRSLKSGFDSLEAELKKWIW